MTLVLAIESSFDDTGIAFLDEKSRVAFSAVSSSVELHAPYGGVVPEIAARDHMRNLPLMFREAIYRKNDLLENVTAIGVTRGPGLPGCLLAGVGFARGLKLALSVPLYGLNHLEGHLFSPFFGASLSELSFPFIGLVVTGGNTALYLVKDVGSTELLGWTLDDAAGELFDKIAFKLGLGYPGGKRIEEFASMVSEDAIPKELDLPVPMRDASDLCFSYSGLKTSALRLIRRLSITRDSSLLPHFCSSLSRSVWESLWLKIYDATQLTGIKVTAISGGVSANRLFRNYLTQKASATGISITFPEPRLCTDNAEMMAYLLLLKLQKGPFAEEEFDIDANLI